MSFSFRGLFQQSAEPGGSPTQASDTMPPTHASPFGSPQSPFGNATPLFKVANPDTLQGQPVQASAGSPFAPANSPSTATPLTVGDVLPQLPPEIARVGALAPDQPVAISPQIIDAALRSGEASVPIFEIYRVCPALFQTPISPQDPRVVPLPAASLPRLIASTQPSQGHMEYPASQTASAPTPAAFPFSPASSPQPNAIPSPFGQMPPENAPHAAPPASPFNATGTLLPPKRMGSPPPLADVQTASPPSMILPASQPFSGGAPMPGSTPPNSPFSVPSSHSVPASPFGMNGGGAHPPATPVAPSGASPFSVKPPGEASKPVFSASSPFGMAEPAQAPASPFKSIPASATSGTQPNLASLFASPTLSAPPTSALPPQAAAPAITSPFQAAAASPFEMAAPAGAPQAASVFGAPVNPSPAPAQQMPPAAHSPSGHLGTQGNIRIPFSTLLKGYTVAELGFDPIMVPSWIITTVPTSALTNQNESGRTLVELGLLVDGITDLGFRNVLSHAKRDFQLGLSPDDISLVLNAGGPPSLPNLSGLGTATHQSPPPSIMPPAGAPPSPPPMMNTPFRVEPTTQQGFIPPSHGQPMSMPSTPAAPMPQMPMAATPPPQTPFSVPAAFPATPAPQGQPFLPPQFPPQAPVEIQAVVEPAPPAEPATFPSAFSAFLKSAPEQPSSSGFPVQAHAPHHRSHDLVVDASPIEEPQEAFPAFEQPAFASAPELPQTLDAGFGPPPAPTRSAFIPPTVEGWGSEQLLSPEPAPAPPRREQPQSSPAPSSVSKSLPALPQELSSSFLLGEDEDDSHDIGIPEPRKMVRTEPTPRRSAPAPVKRPSASAAGKASSFLGVQPHNTDSDQMLLRALLCTDEDLNPQRVVEMTASLSGIAACVCLHGDEVFAHAGAHKPQAREFKQQAPDLIHHLHSLAPLIGIDGAETFTLNAGDRLMTFCFPQEGPIFGILHDDEPSLGLRDKITLIARELGRMLD